MTIKKAVVTAMIAGAMCLNAASFVNGNFETGDASGWTIGGGYRGNVLNPNLDAKDLLPGGSLYSASVAAGHSSIVTAGLDPNTGNQLNRVYSGDFSWRVEDLTIGGYASVISQKVDNYSDAEIFFAWAAVLEAQHGQTDAATMKIFLRDLTIGDVLISREYNAASNQSGVDPRFRYENTTGFFWTPWQIEQLTLPADRLGHSFELSVLASDCEPTGHAGYLYLDGFGAVAPPGATTPEPSTFFLMAAGFGVVGLGLRRRRLAAAVVNHSDAERTRNETENA